MLRSVSGSLSGLGAGRSAPQDHSANKMAAPGHTAWGQARPAPHRTLTVIFLKSEKLR